jgi:hypothetical protein
MIKSKFENCYVSKNFWLVVDIFVYYGVRIKILALGVGSQKSLNLKTCLKFNWYMCIYLYAYKC